MKLYKFRSLGSCTDLERTQAIIESGKFWCSRFWELNDPMEGVYWFNKGGLTEPFIRKLYDAKSKHAFCSFSGPKAFEHPLMWGYYANGFKGVAIEIEIDIDSDANDVKPITYSSELANVMQDNDTFDAARRILMTKLCCWSHEDEYRYLHKGDHGLRKIGKITAVYFGNPYKTTVNREEAQRRPRVSQYLCRVESLKETASRKRVKCRQVDIEDGRVVQMPEVG